MLSPVVMVNVRSSWCPKASIHIHGVPTGAAAAFMICPTTARSASAESARIGTSLRRFGGRCFQRGLDFLFQIIHRLDRGIDKRDQAFGVVQNIFCSLRMYSPLLFADLAGWGPIASGLS